MKTDKKIEEIYMDTLKLTDDEWVAKYGEGNGYHEAFETLIQAERKEAVEGFVKWQFNEDNPIKMQRWNIIGFSLNDMLDEVKEYLESEEK